MASERWWSEYDASVNGVFKGGGAKGLLYAGAIQAVHETGRWFRATAGSSAGAITATLIAAGLEPEALTDAAHGGPARVGRNWLGDLIGQPLFLTGRLRRWLETLLRRQTKLFGTRPDSSDAPVSFRELYEATAIELYVVAVDVAQRQPVVFSWATTPHLSVADAVLASSAIPVAFRPGRLEVEVGGSTQVHRLIDGGVWANYPAFVFKDRSFREHHGLGELPRKSMTVGFTLEHRASEPAPVPKRLLTRWLSPGGDRGAGLRGWLRFGPLRLYLLTVVPIVIAVQAWWTIDHYGLIFLKDLVGDNPSAPAFLQRLAGFFDGFFSHFWPGFLSMVAFLVVLAVVFTWLGASLIDSALPAMRSLMAVGTNVPYWVGTTFGDNVVRLQVPDYLGTLSFRLPAEKVRQAIESARQDTRDQLEEFEAPV